VVYELDDSIEELGERCKGFCHKEGRGEGGGGDFSSRNVIRTKGVLQTRTFILFGVKNSDFSKLMDIFRKRGEVFNFSRFCANVFL